MYAVKCELTEEEWLAWLRACDALRSFPSVAREYLRQPIVSFETIEHRVTEA